MIRVQDDNFSGINFVYELMNVHELPKHLPSVPIEDCRTQIFNGYAEITRCLSDDMRSDLSDRKLLQRIQAIIRSLLSIGYDREMDSGEKRVFSLNSIFSFPNGKPAESKVDQEKAFTIAFAIFNASPPPKGRGKCDIVYDAAALNGFISHNGYFNVSFIAKEAGDTAAPAEKRV